ncbi:Ankyrin-1 [Metarhizium anisopliae]|nr:Ankyrin-1 [Metarhizium anisopliae]
MSLKADTPSVDTQQQAQIESTSSAVADADANASQPEPHRNGIVVRDPDLDPNAAIGFDVVGVHGLHGQSWNSWKASDPGPQAGTWLGHDWGNVPCKSARVILYGYDSDEDSGNCYTVRGVYHEAHALLDRLLELRSPKVLIFIGYPHRPLSPGDLEEQLCRLLSLRRDRHRHGNSMRLVKSLAETITHVNHAFVHTKLLTQAKMVNMYSTHEDAAKSVFGQFTMTMGIPQEYRVPSGEAHMDLTRCSDNDSHPIKGLPDQDWLEGEYTPSQVNILRRVADQAPLCYPSLNEAAEMDQSAVDGAIKLKGNHILHVQCSSGTVIASEMVRTYLRDSSQMMLYFRFDAHDVRCNSSQAALASFVAQIIFQCLETRRPAIQSIIENLESTKAWPTDDLFAHWQYLRVYAGELISRDYFRSFPACTESIHVLECFDECNDSLLWLLSELKAHFSRTEDNLKLVITTTKGTKGDLQIAEALSHFPQDAVSRIEYSLPDAVPVQVGFETSMLTQENPRYAAEHLQSAIKSLISRFSNDESLCRLLMEWLRSTPNPSDSVPRLLGKLETPRPELLFETVLSEIPSERRPWAQKLISWVLSAVRPLRTVEFCVVSDLCLGSVKRTAGDADQGNTTAHNTIAHTLQLLGGILVVVHDEIQFCHSAIRPWLESSERDQQQPGPDGWYLQTTERGRHLDILQTCLAHLRGGNDQTGSGASLLPYAVEFWTRHLTQAGPLDDILETVFHHPPTLKRWIDAYSALPAFHERIPVGSRTPLPVAAHFGLDNLVASLLEVHKDDVELRGLALVEAARQDRLSTLRLILDSCLSDLGFDDDYLHSAVKVAASSGNLDLFRELVNHIPKPPHDIPRRRPKEEYTTTQQTEQSASSKDHATNILEDEGLNKQEVTILVEGNDPLLWLAFPLCRASSLGMEDVVAKLLALGSDPNPPKELLFDHLAPLHLAGRGCHAGVAKLLVDAGASLTANTKLGETPLHIAAAFGSQDIVKMLLDNGAAVDIKDKYGLTPLQSACERGHFLAAETILRHRKMQDYLPPEAEDQPLVSSVRRGYYKTAQVLLRNGADPNAIDGGATALLQAVIGKNLDMIKLLVDFGADVNKVEAVKWQRPPLFVAASDDYLEAVRYLISNKADVNMRDGNGNSPLWIAALYGYTETVRVLAEANAGVNDVCGDGEWLPLHAAYEHPDTTSALVDLGADTTRETGRNGTPLEYAINYGQVETCKVLLNEPKDKPDLTRGSTQEMVAYAVEEGYSDVVSLMLEAGVDVNAVDEENRTLVGCAIAAGHEDMVRTILEYRPDLDIRDVNECTALHCITQKTTVGSVRHVVNAGCKLDGIDKYKLTPLLSAIEAGNDEVVEYLLTKKAITATLSTPVERWGAPLHGACEVGTLRMVELLLQSGSDVNLDCRNANGTPLMATSGRTHREDDADKEKIFRLLLEKGADPTLRGGFSSYPIISASLGCKSSIVKSLLDRKVSIDVQDSCGRKPAHVASYNSLEVLALLRVPDSDFAIKDAVGRVPLHYAVLSGQVDLLKEVLARSMRVGVDVNVRDKDGWTPLLWAARAANIVVWEDRRAAHHDEIVTFLLDNGADPCVSGRGPLGDWTALEVAQYHNYDSIPGLAEANVSSQRPSSRRKRRGRRVERWFCDCCEVELWGVYFTCTDCYNYTLCFKCYKHSSIVHPGHGFKDSGDDFDVEEDAAEKTESGPAGPVNGDAVPVEEEGPVYDFDEEIVGDDGSMTICCGTGYIEKIAYDEGSHEAE